MILRIAEYNMEWMSRLFTDGEPAYSPPSTSTLETDLSEDEKDTIRSQHLIRVLEHLDADLIAVVEAPTTLQDETKTASGQLEKWLTKFNFSSRNYKAIHGYPSRGQQELAVLYDSDKLIVEFTPAGEESFNEVFIVDTLAADIDELYSHYRPPLELTIKQKEGQVKLFKMIVAHSKSKGIFNNVDYARYEHLSILNRRKLYAECMHMRRRVDKWISRGENVIVTGDINDGMGNDFYEGRLGRSAIELLMGSVYEPELILKSALGKPKLTNRGWSPNSSTFTDKITKDWFTVLIDHILVSQSIEVLDGVVLNPWSKPHNTALPDNIKEALKKGSDHFPVNTEIRLEGIQNL